MTITLTDKHNQLSQFKRDMFNKTLTMFEWNNLPDTLPQVELEKLLQINGYAIIAECNGSLYAFSGGFSGQDAYKRPTTAIINNPALNFNEQLEIGKQCVVIKNDDMQQGLNKIFDKYGDWASFDESRNYNNDQLTEKEILKTNPKFKDLQLVDVDKFEA